MGRKKAVRKTDDESGPKLIPKTASITLETKRPVTIGEVDFGVGDTLAEVELPDGYDVYQLVTHFNNGIIGPRA